MILLKQQCNVNAQDTHGLTPLHYIALKAATNQTKTYYLIYERILQNLLNFGAKLEIKAKDESTALDIAKQANDPNMLEMLSRAAKQR